MMIIGNVLASDVDPIERHSTVTNCTMYVCCNAKRAVVPMPMHRINLMHPIVKRTRFHMCVCVRVYENKYKTTKLIPPRFSFL